MTLCSVRPPSEYMDNSFYHLFRRHSLSSCPTSFLFLPVFRSAFSLFFFLLVLLLVPGLTLLTLVFRSHRCYFTLFLYVFRPQNTITRALFPSSPYVLPWFLLISLCYRFPFVSL
ncbi:hypothetical protein GGU10DRAFT_346936 [Lentinula aff. detonsa]|uniref:Uncharacterized protein n=1 Tax=Lentinula aff. detonsa TaxID=2804958 RepID=A0AA38KSQ2_9AGAR|nr:hypothetical protein GGU10DRAFT_346936 [Lentinula aff. detonsa]